MTDIDSILERGLNELMPSISLHMPGITSRMLKTESKQDVFPAGRCGYADLVGFVEQRGEILACHDFSNMVVAKMRGGFRSMNPALVIFCIDGDQVWVGAYAKEGLIKQRTAEKLLDRIRTEFEREFGSYQISDQGG